MCVKVNNNIAYRKLLRIQLIPRSEHSSYKRSLGCFLRGRIKVSLHTPFFPSSSSIIPHRLILPHALVDMHTSSQSLSDPSRNQRAVRVCGNRNHVPVTTARDEKAISSTCIPFIPTLARKKQNVISCNNLNSLMNSLIFTRRSAIGVGTGGIPGPGPPPPQFYNRRGPT